jgi:N-acetylmuramoyl-L-alanine amidase
MVNFLINQNHLSLTFDERIKFLILHYTERDFKTSLKLLQDRVSAHYLINDSPVEILQLVPDEKRAWHAGESFWGGRSNLNDSSIGIEIVNLDGNKNAYPDEQIETVMFLCKKLIKKYQIAPQNILAHSDIAPLRKNDPGKLFPWHKLFENDIGAMFDENEVKRLMADQLKLPDALNLQKSLARYGYQINFSGNFDDQTQKTLDAFRKHFCPKELEKPIEARSWAILQNLIEKYC